MDRTKGTLIIKVYVLQSATPRAIHGSKQAAKVKYTPMDMFATKVLHFGPTYSKTENFK